MVDTFSSEQGYVVRGILAAILVAIAALGLGYWLMPLAGSDLAMPGAALAYVMKADLLMVPMLAAGIAAVASGRFFSRAIDGRTDDLPDSVESNRRYIQNTLEQLVVALPTHLALGVLLPAAELRMIPVLAGLFVVGRLTFWIGYRRFPTGRAFGFALTFYPTMGALVYALWCLVQSIF